MSKKFPDASSGGMDALQARISRYLRGEIGADELNRTEAAQVEPLPVVNAEDTLYAIAFCSARALLILQGIEARSDASVFDIFLQQFILSGLIDRKFEAVIAAARARDANALAGLKTDVFALLDAASELYKKINDTRKAIAGNRFIN